jgi:hypothetical protein
MTGARAGVPPRHMTVTDFFEWDGGGHQGKLELVEGEVPAQAPGSATHGLIQANLVHLLQQHCRVAGVRCMVLTEPAVGPRLSARQNVRVPDLGATCSPIQAGQILMPEPLLLIVVHFPAQHQRDLERAGSFHDPDRAGNPGRALDSRHGRASAESRRRGVAWGSRDHRGGEHAPARRHRGVVAAR